MPTRCPRADEPARGDPVSPHEPDDPPIGISFPVRRPGVPDNPNAIRVRDRLPRAARAW
ncbi:hypothetical protein [Streptomyces sp. enrichment culture]|uniref:hypothetical protein n=1 Tax=Streptomyces sp. enrichment culture TaxID=1795815 RepID=UPI003F576420